MPDTVDRVKVTSIIQKNNPNAYAKCVAKGCGTLSLTEVGPGTVMYYCPTHNYNGTVYVG